MLFSMAVLLASVFWELALRSSPTFAAIARVVSAVLALLGALIAVAILYVAAAGVRNRRALVGSMAVERPLSGG